MRRYVFSLLLVVLVSLPALAADLPLDEQPMYGGAQRTPDMVKADDAFIQGILDQGLSREEGARHLAFQGWQAFIKGDTASAVKLFNRSWLLAQDVYSTYWGFALVYLIRDNDVPHASTMFEKALSLAPERGRFYVEYGRFIDEHDPDNVDKAIGLFMTGLGLDPKLRDGYIGLLRAYVRKKDPAGVRLWFERAKQNKVLTPAETERFESAIAAMEKGGQG